MSRVPTAEDKSQIRRMGDAMAGLRRMIEQGRSFSGNERNCCFLNLPNKKFATISAISGLDYPDDGRAYALVDWDQDGDLDIWASNRNAPRLRFLRNNTPETQNYVMFHLQGNGKTTNRDAIGARVELVMPGLQGKKLIRTVRAGEGFLAQSSRWVHFGLGNNRRIDKVIVHWPAGKVEEFSGAVVKHRYRLEQGAGKAKKVAARQRQTALKPAVQKPLPSSRMRIPLVALLPMPKKAAYFDFEGNRKILSLENGKPTLIVLWASWCGPCRLELNELTKRAGAIRSAGVNVVALAVDGLGEDNSKPAAADAFCKHVAFPFLVGKARASFVQLMTGYHHSVVALTKPLPIPTSLLVDGRGRLSVIYKGRVSVDQVLKDARSSTGTLPQRWRRAAFLPGATLDRKELYGSLGRSEANHFFALADTFGKGQQLANAEAHFRCALAAAPDFGAALRGLALVLDARKKFAQALKYYEKARRHFPKDATLCYNIGNIHQRAKRFDKAIACYRSAVKLKSNYLKAHMNLGVTLTKQNRFKEAKGQFEEVLRIDPNFLPARLALDRLKVPAGK